MKQWSWYFRKLKIMGSPLTNPSAGTDHLLWLPIWRRWSQTDTGESTSHPWVLSPRIQGRSKKFSWHDWVSLQVYTPVCFTHETVERVDT